MLPDDVAGPPSANLRDVAKGRPVPVVPSPQRPPSVLYLTGSSPPHRIVYRRTERSERAGRVILAPVEATVDESLDTMTQRVE